jgi:uncharacterized membrane protein
MRFQRRCEMEFWIGLVIGLFIGANVGLFIGANVGLLMAALCRSASIGDRLMREALEKSGKGLSDGDYRDQKC